jgi:uncharacterized membrane protein YhhN
MLFFLPVLVVMTVSVGFLLRAEFAGDDRGIRAFKPISSALMTAILLMSLLRGGSRAEYTFALLPGMLLAFAGDMALMFQARSKAAFKAGLALFLACHLAYAAAFTAFAGFSAHDLASGLVLAAAAACVYLYLRPGLGEMKVPVLAYVLIISLMANRAVSAFFGAYFSPVQAALLATGAAFFYASDVVLAVHRFRRPWRYGRINLAFYYVGQVLIALSASFFG